MGNVNWSDFGGLILLAVSDIDIKMQMNIVLVAKNVAL